jgi:membrane-associated phospholipid phosphatase
MSLRVRSLPAQLLPHGPLDAVRQVLLFAAAYYGYRLTRGVVDDPQAAAVAFENARHLIRIEQATGIFVEPTIQAWAASKPLVIDFASWMYINAQSSVTLAAIVYIYLFHNASFYFVRNMFIVALGLAIVGYVVFPTAPPRFMPEWGFTDSVAAFTGVNADSASADLLFNPFAAIPSMHVAFALMLGATMARMTRRRWAQALWCAYAPVVTFVVIATANHWWIDGFLGAVVAAVSAVAAHGVLARARPDVWAFTPQTAGALP